MREANGQVGSRGADVESHRPRTGDLRARLTPKRNRCAFLVGLGRILRVPRLVERTEAPTRTILRFPLGSSLEPKRHPKHRALGDDSIAVATVARTGLHRRLDFGQAFQCIHFEVVQNEPIQPRAPGRRVAVSPTAMGPNEPTMVAEEPRARQIQWMVSEASHAEEDDVPSRLPPPNATRPRRAHNRWPWLAVGTAVLAVAALGTLQVRPRTAPLPTGLQVRPVPIDLSAYSDLSPKKPIRLLFIHHSSGGQLFADVGSEKERANCILETHPNGGGLRKLLMTAGYEIHEASYGSEVGENTDLFDWLPKLESKMDRVLRVDENDRALPEGQTHQVVIFKSCYPNNRFEGEGTEPGDSRGPALTVTNAKATMRALLPLFAKHPEVLFVYFTAPPNSPNPKAMPIYRYAIDTLRGGRMGRALASQAALARRFNAWVVSKDGWLADYSAQNVVIYDYYETLTEHGKSDLSAFASGDGTDNHPASAGNQKAASEFVPFLNRAVRRAGLTD